MSESLSQYSHPHVYGYAATLLIGALSVGYFFMKQETVMLNSLEAHANNSQVDDRGNCIALVTCFFTIVGALVSGNFVSRRIPIDVVAADREAQEADSDLLGHDHSQRDRTDYPKICTT